MIFIIIFQVWAEITNGQKVQMLRDESLKGELKDPTSEYSSGVLGKGSRRDDEKEFAREEDNQETSHTFQNLLIKQVTRSVKPKKNEGECVMDEKFAIVVWAEFEIHDRARTKFTFRFFQLSMPIVVIVNGCQATRSWATVFWDNAFAHHSRPMFQVTYGFCRPSGGLQIMRETVKINSNN